jgi:hypothetical protein
MPVAALTPTVHLADISMQYAQRFRVFVKHVFLPPAVAAAAAGIPDKAAAPQHRALNQFVAFGPCSATTQPCNVLRLAVRVSDEQHSDCPKQTGPGATEAQMSEVSCGVLGYGLRRT